MKSYITASFYTLLRVLSLLLQGYLFGSRFARFEFRRSFFRPWLDSLGGVGAWLFVGVVAVCGCGFLWLCVWLLLWLADDIGMIM